MTTTKIQKSSSFILPILGLSTKNMYQNGFQNTYMGSNMFSSGNQWGEHFILEFNSAMMDPEYLEELRNHSFYKTEYDPTNQITHVVFDIPETYKNTIVKPFLKGKYSEIDRDYVNRYYGPKRNYQGIYEISYNYKILTKHPEIKDWWEYRLGVTLPDDAEVWSKPEKEDEIFMYVKEKEDETSTSR